MEADERLDDLQLCGLRILQKRRGFRFGMDAVLLADFARVRPEDHVADFGTGTGILPLLLIGREKGRHFDAFEIQPGLADMARRTMALNGLDERVRVHALPAERASEVLPPCSVDAVVCNPPYGQPGSTLHSPAEDVDLARHQAESGLLPWFKTAHRLLRGHGRLSVIYPAPGMLGLMRLMEEARLTPKRFRLVYPKTDRPANLALVEAVKDARPMLQPMPPLVIYEQDGGMTAELRRIYHLQEDA